VDRAVVEERPLPATHATLGGMNIETRTLEEVLRDLDSGLRDLHGKRYGGLVLYGSQVRGEADEGSDVDLLLLLEGPVEVGWEIRRSSGVVAPLALEAGGSTDTGLQRSTSVTLEL
jgi:hypothetical protein